MAAEDEGDSKPYKFHAVQIPGVQFQMQLINKIEGELHRQVTRYHIRAGLGSEVVSVDCNESGTDITFWRESRQ
jgi:hypothetical protein